MSIRLFARTAFVVLLSLVPVFASAQTGSIGTPRALSCKAVVDACGYASARAGANNDITELQHLTTPLSGAQGGTGWSNPFTIKLGGNLQFAGAYDVVFTFGAGTSLTFPATGTVQTTTGSLAAMTGLLSGQVTTALGYTPLRPSLNLSDVSSASTAWSNLGGGASGKHPDSYFLQAGNNLSDLGSASTARTNLGVTATGADTNYAFRANNLSDLLNAATARANLGVTATGADTTYAFRGNNLSDVSNVATARTNLGLATVASSGSAGDLGAGTLASARLVGLYTGVTGLGTQASDLLFTDATYDIGKSGATRPRDIFASRNVTVGGTAALTNVAETYTAPAISSGTLTIDLAGGTVFNVASNANITTFTISNATASKVSAFTLILTANGTGYTQAWGSSVKWPDATAPTLTTTNAKRDVLSFLTNDGGTTWLAFVGGQRY